MGSLRTLQQGRTCGDCGGKFPLSEAVLVDDASRNSTSVRDVSETSLDNVSGRVETGKPILLYLLG